MKPTVTISGRLRDEALGVGVKMELLLAHPKKMNDQQKMTFFNILDRITAEVKIKLGAYLTEVINDEANKNGTTKRK